MKLKITALLAVMLFTSTAFTQTAPAAKTEAQEAQNKAQTKEELLRYMQQTRQNFLNSVKGLSEAQLKFKAAPDKWSVMEVSEHIALSEDLLGGMSIKVMSAPATEKKAEMYGKEDKLIAGVTDRSQKRQAPDVLKPTGKWATEADILAAFNASRDKNVDFVRKTSEEDMRSRMEKSPAGELDAHEWMLFTASHSARHTKQIEEVKADPNFPKS
ncbi:MAG: hypothetical protein JWN45_104 [Acidobacteriaceae bacterium]|nr:hypothetical protein [Acidobacteriaceae bacterium]